MVVYICIFLVSTYIISDIHGCNKTFQSALKAVKLKKNDKLIVLGDLIDRGPDSKGVLDSIIALKHAGFDLVCLKGNHEQMLLDVLNDNNLKSNWLLNGGHRTLSSFLTSSVEKIPIKYLELIKTFKSYYTMDKFIFVHAGLNMLATDPFEDEKSHLWLRNWGDVYNDKWLGERIVIHGHTPNSANEISLSINNKVVCIDNGCFLQKEGYGNLVVLRLDDLKLHFEPNAFDK